MGIIDGNPAAAATREAVGRNEAEGGEQPLGDTPVVLSPVNVPAGTVAEPIVRRLDGKLGSAIPDNRIVEAATERAVLQLQRRM
jgi:hypothetical protein